MELCAVGILPFDVYYTPLRRGFFLEEQMIGTGDQERARLSKLQQLCDLGIEAYPPAFERSHTSVDLLEERTKLLDSGDTVSYAGRIVRFNRKGKIAFIHVKDSFSRIQAVLSESEIGAGPYQILKLSDLGDWVGITGSMFTTNSGEFSIRATSFSMLSKATRPMPIPKEKIADGQTTEIFDLMQDKELRYRQRYIDLTINDEVRTVFQKRSRIIQAIRAYLDGLGYMEVETPVLQPIYGGANARPFETHHKAQNLKMYLRISNELYLKRCIIGGFEKVFEFARDFRNEGVDRTHNPEFTLLEFYEAYADYQVMMDRVEELVLSAVRSVSPTTTIDWQDHSIDYKSPWRRIRFYDALRQYTGIDVEHVDTDRLLERKGIDSGSSNHESRGKLLLDMFEQEVAPHLIQPCIVYDFPKEASPLCRPHRSDSDLIEQFEVYIGGMEITNAYSELIDPLAQRYAFEQQAEMGRGKDDEHHPVDEDFLHALESGMPPTGGVGIGIDRLVMLLTGMTNIRDVLLFPLMKPAAR